MREKIIVAAVLTLALATPPAGAAECANTGNRAGCVGGGPNAVYTGPVHKRDTGTVHKTQPAAAATHVKGARGNHVKGAHGDKGTSTKSLKH